MKRVIKNLILCTSLAIFIFSGCSKEYLDINDDPNRVTDDNITPELIFTQAEEGVGGRQGSGDFGFLNNWMGYFAPNGDFAPNQVEQTYNIDFSFADGLWQRHYNVLFDLYQAKNKALASGYTVLAGASMVLSAKLFQELVDLYGDIPYTQAFQSTEIPNPAYDDAQAVYNSLLLSLDSAVTYLEGTAPTSFSTADIIAHGDLKIWIKFANTIRLRLLIRQSQVSGFNPSAEIAKIMSSGGVLEAGENVSVNPGYQNDVNKQSPFYFNYGYDPTGNRASTSVNANEYIVNILASSADPRLGRFFQPVGTNYVGNPYGELPGNISNGANTSYFGPGLIGEEEPGSGTGASQSQWIMTAFESLFLKAEAIARGWMPGDAKTAYEDAVTESFIWLDVPDAIAAAANYLANEDIAIWANAGSTANEQAKFIAMQKYIALCGIDPQESYADQRRLYFLPAGFISVNPARVADVLPIRMLYPQIEYTTNGANVQAEGDIDQFTSKIFWEP